MSRYEKLNPVRSPSGHKTIKAVVVWSEPKLGEDFHYGRVRSEAVLSPRGELLNKTWGEDLAEYIALLAMRTLRHGGVDPESLSRATKEDLRIATGLSAATIAKVGKDGSVTTDVLARICEALDCSLEQITITTTQRGQNEDSPKRA